MDNQSDLLLDWYDRNARDLAWRISPADRGRGIQPDPYRVWLSEVMLQQTTVAAVQDYFRRFTALWPTITDLAKAPDTVVMGQWAGLGYYARARNLLKCARTVVADYQGHFPTSREVLMTLPGIGPYTAAAIAAIAFDHPETVVDGNVERVMARFFAIQTPLPPAKAELTRLATSLTPPRRAGDYAQAVMDLGATICTPKSPTCGLCPWSDGCLACQQGVAAQLPRKVPKKPKPTRVGTVYVARRADGAWLLERRPAKGLLGGMLGWPGSDWSDGVQKPPPIDATWHQAPAEVRHTFTHFHLRLNVMVADVTHRTPPDQGAFIIAPDFRPSDLPTVMRKVFDVAASLVPKR